MLILKIIFLKKNYIILIHFRVKNILKNNSYNTLKHLFNPVFCFYGFFYVFFNISLFTFFLSF